MISPYGAIVLAIFLWKVAAASPLAPAEGRDVLPTRTISRDTSRINFPGACTTTISRHLANPCAWDGTQTIYPATVTRSTAVDCSGCSEIYQAMEIYNCPEQKILATEKARAPSTSWRTVCAPSSTARLPTITGLSDPDSIEQELERRQDAELVGNAGDACPTTFIVQPAQTAGATLTHYRQTATQTVLLDCGGCQLQISTALAGYGPVGKFTATVTAPQGYTTVYKCR